MKPRAPSRWPLHRALLASALWMPANGGCVRAADLDDGEPGVPAAQTSTEGLGTSQSPVVPLLRIWLEDVRCDAVKRRFVHEIERRSGPEFVKLGRGAWRAAMAARSDEPVAGGTEGAAVYRDAAHSRAHDTSLLIARRASGECRRRLELALHAQQSACGVIDSQDTRATLAFAAARSHCLSTPAVP